MHVHGKLYIVRLCIICNYRQRLCEGNIECEVMSSCTFTILDILLYMYINVNVCACRYAYMCLACVSVYSYNG